MSTDSPAGRLGKFLSVFKYSRVALKLVWNTSAALTVVMGLSTLVTGILPAAIASVGGFIVDAVVTAINTTGAEQEQAQMRERVGVGVGEHVAIHNTDRAVFGY